MDEGLSKSLLEMKEIGLENALSNGWSLKSALEMKKLRSNRWGLESIVEQCQICCL